jgi:hypothetical protein
MINESLKRSYEGNRNEIYNLGNIDIIERNGNIIKVDAKDIIDVVDNAMFYMQKKYPYLYIFISSYKIMYVPVYPCRTCETMQVDELNNLWINLNFIYVQCGMKQNNVFGILFHEMFHIFLEHIIRFRKMFPENELSSMPGQMLSILNTKANLAMDYEINASMVDDNIVAKDFWQKMGGLYKKEYTGLTWEEIYRRYGEKEYKEWLERNGTGISDDELEIIKAIEKAAKVLSNPQSTEEDKAKANRELQKTLNKILGKNSESDIRDVFEQMQKTNLGSFGDIGEKLQKIIDDLYKDPSKMSDEQYNELLDDIDQMAREMAKNKSQIADRFGKSEEDTFEDIKKMRKTLRESMDKLRKGKLSAAEKRQVIDKIKDSMEDVISNDLAKEKNDKERRERDEKRANEIKEELKAKHPLRKFINVLINLNNLNDDPYYLVCDKSYDIMGDIIDILDSLTNKPVSEIIKDDVEDLKPLFKQLKNSLFNDLKALLDNDTIINKTEDFLHEILDEVFDYVESAFFSILLNTNLSEDKKISVLKMAAEKMRTIGKILKTQKSWKASDEFKEGYREMRDDLLALFKKDKKATLKKLYDLGVLNDTTVVTLDKRSKQLYDELVSDGEIK